MSKKYIAWLPALAFGSLLVCAALDRSWAQSAAGMVGAFEGHGDVGTVLNAGSVEYDAAKRSYTIAGSGENVWATADAFQFVWKKVSGDVTLTADVSFIGTGGNAHRKAMLMIRQSLETGSAYADAALHGDGLTSLQASEEKGAATHEVQSNVSAPRRLSISKRGHYFYISVAGEGEELHFSGGAMRVPMEEPFYVGIGVCAHDPKVVEKAVFTNVDLATAAPVPAKGLVAYSTLETVTVASTDARVAYVVPERIEASNWTRDGASLLFNSKGRIQRVPAAGGKPGMVDTGFAVKCNSNHGLSPDGALLAISDESRQGRRSIVYTVPAGGGAPKRITQKFPSYFNGWSPDGSTVVFSGERNGKLDVYTIPAAGGRETRLTTEKGSNGNADYSRDGKYIYFNSDRSGTMQIWRMRPDGTEQEQVTDDSFNNWYPHVSPDGRQLLFLSYENGVRGHPENKDVLLRVMMLSNKRIAFLARLVGGAGTIDAPCWSPDSRRVAFVSYQSVPPAPKRRLAK